MSRGKYSRDPARQLAVKAGLGTYMGRPCVHGHEGLRFTKTCQCVACIRGEPKQQKPTPRELARVAGEMYYEGRPCKLGHTRRRVSNAHCVICGREEHQMNWEYYLAYNRSYEQRRDPRGERRRQYKATYRKRHPEQDERRRAEQHAVRRYTTQLLYYPENL